MIVDLGLIKRDYPVDIGLIRPPISGICVNERAQVQWLIPRVDGPVPGPEWPTVNEFDFDLSFKRIFNWRNNLKIASFICHRQGYCNRRIVRGP